MSRLLRTRWIKEGNQRSTAVAKWAGLGKTFGESAKEIGIIFSLTPERHASKFAGEIGEAPANS